MTPEEKARQEIDRKPSVPLDKILHSWKAFSAKAANHLLGQKGTLWQKESFDHIVRSPESLERIVDYIQANPQALSEGMYTLSPSVATRRDAASTWEPTDERLQQVEQDRMRPALQPFRNAKLREAILGTKQALEQVIDEQAQPSKRPSKGS